MSFARTSLLALLLSWPLAARDLTPEELARGRQAVRDFVAATTAEARDEAVAVLESLGAPRLKEQPDPEQLTSPGQQPSPKPLPAIAQFRDLLALDERPLPPRPELVSASVPLGRLAALATVQLPAATPRPTDASDGAKAPPEPLRPLLVVLMPSVLDPLVALDQLERMVGGAFQDEGWVVAVPQPFQLNSELTPRADRTRPKFVRWVSGSGEVVPPLVAHLLRTLPIDPDRVHLLGFGDGGDGVFFTGTRFADHFASITSVDGRLTGRKPTSWVGNMRKLDIFLVAGFVTRTWGPSAVGGVQTLLHQFGARVERITTEDEELFPADELRERLAPIRRRPVDRTLRWFCDRAGYGRYEWARIDACGDRARLAATCDPTTNTIVIEKAEQIESLTFYVDPLLLDPEAELTITHKQGRGRPQRAYRGTPTPTLRTLLESWHTWGDPERLYSRKIELELR